MRWVSCARSVVCAARCVRSFCLRQLQSLCSVSATGVIAGVFNAYFLVRTAARIIAGFNLRFEFPLSVVLATLPVVLLVSLAAAWWTAQRALRLPVVEAIGYE